jgi:hypothetical protein
MDLRLGFEIIEPLEEGGRSAQLSNQMGVVTLSEIGRIGASAVA